jgi:two-component system, NarL family, invasion response regulator UvrY
LGVFVLRVLLVDDHRLLRHGVRQIVEQAGAVVCEASTGEAALKALTTGPFDVAIVDLTLPDVTGLDLLRRLHERRPHLPIVVLSLHGPEHLAQQAFNAGALAYLTKDTAPADLIEAIKLARHGRPYLSPQVRAAVVEVTPRHRTLSAREYQVMRMLAEGRTVSEAAADLGISVKTVSTYRSRMLDKLGMKTNAEVMRYALRQHLVD